MCDNSLRITMSKKEQPKQWLVKYSDGYTRVFLNPFKPTGNASRHLHAEKEKGRDHISIVSIRELPEEANVKPIQPKENGNHAATVTVLEKKKEEIQEFIEEISPELDSELYRLIQKAMTSVEFTEKLLYKFFDMTQEDSDIYDNLFLIEYVKRIRRSVYEIDDNLSTIEKNLES